MLRDIPDRVTKDQLLQQRLHPGGFHGCCQRVAATVGGHVWSAAPVLHCRAPSIIKVLAAAISQTVGGHLHGLGYQRHDGGGNGDLPVLPAAVLMPPIMH